MKLKCRPSDHEQPDTHDDHMVAIGLGAAAVGFLIGRLFHTAGV